MRIAFNNDWNYKNGGIWQQVSIPHDAMIDSPRRKDAAGGGACAYFDGGIYEYEKKFTVPAEWADKTAWLEFGGVYRNAKVYINDRLAGEWAYGYSEFAVTLDGFLEYGKENAVRVVADNSKLPNSRWYTGGGIYRPVFLVVKNKVHIVRHGITVNTLSISPAKIRVRTNCRGGELKLSVFDGDRCVAVASGMDTEITVPNAKLWSDETPHLYSLKAELFENGELADEEEVSFGIRTLAWSKEGFFVNGKSVLLRGGCVHHDNGILGARAYAEAEERKVRIIKEAGFNAVRFSHNPCSEAFAAACDKYGIYLIDEFSDMWYMRKKKYDYALDFPKWYKKDITSIVRKDYNHPSVIMYSIGNEVSEPSEQKGMETAEILVRQFQALDPTRPVTAGVNLLIIKNAANGGGEYSVEKVETSDQPRKRTTKATSSALFNMIATRVGPSMNKMANSEEADKITMPLFAALDVCGYNYASGRYELDGVKHPNRVIYGSETFPQDIWKNWEMVKKYPYLVGDFMWTAWDYLGEVGIGGWSYEPQYGMTFEKPYPWMIADTGAIDLIGNIGAEAKYASTVWGLERQPYIGVRPVNHPKTKVVKSVWRGTNAIASWSWSGCEGNRAEIEVYSDACAIALYRNGKKIGKKKVKECRAIFKTKYKPGILKAVALNAAGKIVGESELRTADNCKICISCEKSSAKAGEVLFFDVAIADKNGTVESNADCRLTANVENGELLAFDSARQKTEDKYSSPVCETYYGRALAVVKAGKKGVVKLTVSGKGKKESIIINIR